MCSSPLLSRRECQRKRSLSNLSIIVLRFVLPILAKVLFFLFWSAACTNKAEVRFWISLISKPADFFRGFLFSIVLVGSSAAWLIFVFDLYCGVPTCEIFNSYIHHSLFSSLERGIESRRLLEATLFERKSCIHVLWTDFKNFSFLADKVSVSMESNSLLVD